MSLWETISDAIEAETGARPEAGDRNAVGGGSISRSFRVTAGDRTLFVKVNGPDAGPMFAAEAEGLALLREPGVIRVPEPVCHGVDGGGAFLVLEHIDFGRPAADGEQRMGEGLARIHAVTRPEHGWDRDNTIGSTPQPNAPDADWARFFARQRLGFQLDLVEADGGHAGLVKTGRELQSRVGQLLAGHTPPASLLHGDLWGGNASFDLDGRPVIYDPAVYFGDRETDLAMTELFGGFSREFRAAYETAWPLEAGYGVRRELYQLYHVLNHLNLFGGMYAGSARRLIDGLLAEVR